MPVSRVARKTAVMGPDPKFLTPGLQTASQKECLAQCCPGACGDGEATEMHRTEGGAGAGGSGDGSRPRAHRPNLRRALGAPPLPGRSPFWRTGPDPGGVFLRPRVRRTPDQRASRSSPERPLKRGPRELELGSLYPRGRGASRVSMAVQLYVRVRNPTRPLHGPEEDTTYRDPGHCSPSAHYNGWDPCGRTFRKTKVVLLRCLIAFQGVRRFVRGVQELSCLIPPTVAVTSSL